MVWIFDPGRMQRPTDMDYIAQAVEEDIFRRSLPFPGRLLGGQRFQVIFASDYQAAQDRRHISLPPSIEDPAETLQIRRLEGYFHLLEGFRLDLRPRQQREFLRRLHRNGYAVARVIPAGGVPETRCFVIYDNRHRSNGDSVLSHITQLSVTEPEGVSGAEPGHYLRNFWLIYKMAMALHEAQPELLGSSALAAYALFRRTDAFFKGIGDHRTGPLLFHAQVLMALTGGPDHLQILAGAFPEKFIAAVRLESLLQFQDVLRNPLFTYAIPAARARQEEFFRELPHLTLGNIQAKTDEVLEELAQARALLHRPEAMGRDMGHWVDFQLRMLGRHLSVRSCRAAAQALTLRRLAGQGPYPPDFRPKTDAQIEQEPELFSHTQLWLGVLYWEALKALLGRDGARLFPSRIEARLRFVRRAGRKGQAHRPPRGRMLLWHRGDARKKAKPN